MQHTEGTKSTQARVPSQSEATKAQDRVNALTGADIFNKSVTTSTFGEIVIQVHNSRTGCEIRCAKGGIDGQSIGFQIYPPDAPFFADSIMSQGCVPAENAAILSKVLDEVLAAQ